MTKRVYIVDDDAAIRKSLLDLLRGEGYQPKAYPDIRGLTRDVDVQSAGILLLDIAMPGEDGLTFLRRCPREYPGIGVIMITGEASIERAVAATKLGAFDFLEKPLSPPKLLLSLRNLAQQMSLNARIKERDSADADRYRLIGSSRIMQELYEKLALIATAESTVLITGENGTGKELVAYHLWAGSRRRDLPYIKVNCAAIPADLAEAELFGHRRGAFTGADRDRKGKFKAADGGTLFLDEIGDLSASIQAKLLRIIETGECEVLGSDSPEQVDVRLIVATNRDLKQRVESRAFREDLYYRLNVVPLEVPPLRERREDIGELVAHFAAKLAESSGLGAKTFTPAAIGFLSGLEYRGNVRELRNIVERCYIMSRSEIVDLDEMELLLGREYITTESEADEGRNRLTVAIRNFEKSFLAAELARANGNISELARALEIDRGNLSRKLKSYGIV